MPTQTKGCIACAERIQADAKLCKHCRTWQNDSRFDSREVKPNPRTGTNFVVGAKKVNFFISWWAQLISVAVVLINPDAGSFTNPLVFLLNVSAQLLGWNICISIAFTIAYFGMKLRGLAPHRVRSWLFSSLVFGAFGFLVLMLTIGFSR